MTLLEALSPTTAALLDADVHFFTITYTFTAPILGELQNSAVIYGVDAEAALASFRSKNPKVTRAWLAGKVESENRESGNLKGATL